MDGHAFLANLALVLGVAALTTVVFQRLRLPVVFGYLMAGMIVGPYLPIPLVADAEMVRALAELGVILLMFAIGLEFRLAALVRLASTAGLAALVECALMFGFGYALAEVMGWTRTEALFTGGCVAISSTTIIARTFAEKGIGGTWREVTFGVLLVEDLIAIVLVALLSAVAAGAGLSARDLGVTLAQLATFLVALLGLGLVGVPRLVRHVIGLARPDVTIVLAVGLAFGAAWAAMALGYSVALGAFIAGSLVAESGHGEAVEHLVAPVRDVFVAIFFVAVGMLLDPRAVASNAGATVALIALVLVGKVVAVSTGLFLTGTGLRDALRAGMSLAQIGEFSFIIAGVGLAAGVVRPALYPVAVAVSAVTSLLTPWLVDAADRTASAVDRRMPRPLQTFLSLYGSWIERVRTGTSAPASPARVPLRSMLLDLAAIVAVLLGAAAESRRLGVWLGEVTGTGEAAGGRLLVALALVLALPFAAGVVRTSRALARALALRAMPLAQGGRADRANAPRRALISTLHGAILFACAALLLAVSAPLLPAAPGAGLLAVIGVGLVAMVWRDAGQLYGHATAGAEVIVLALTQHDRFAAPEPELKQTMEHVSAMLPGLGEPVPVRVPAGSPADGRTLKELDLRSATGAIVLAVMRPSATGGEAHIPAGDERLQAGDVVALAGAQGAVRAARALLEGAPA